MSCRITALKTEIPVKEYVRTCVDVEKFLALCRQCPNYDRNWACPPFSFDPMDIWNRYEVLELHALVLEPSGDMTREALMNAFLREKLRLSKQVLELEHRTEGSLSMAASTCIACSPCLRSLGKPCCHPEQVRYSIEALGGDVGKTMEQYFHRPIIWIAGTPAGIPDPGSRPFAAELKLKKSAALFMGKRTAFSKEIPKKTPGFWRKLEVCIY